MEWSAFEQVYGPILVHERVDVGLAQLGMIMAKLWGKGNPKPKDFLPSWYRRPADPVLDGFQALMRMAENGGNHSDD